MSEVTFRFTGLSPLMQSNPAGMLAAATRKPSKTSSVEAPELEAAKRVYRNALGELYHPAEAFRSALIDAASGYKVGKTYIKTLIMGGVFIATETAPLLDPASGEPIMDYIVDCRRCVVQSQGIVRARPRIERWMTTVAFDVDEGVFTDSRVLLTYFEIAGRTVGVGEYRPKPPKFSSGKGGPFGRFTAELM